MFHDFVTVFGLIWAAFREAGRVLFSFLSFSLIEISLGWHRANGSPGCLYSYVCRRALRRKHLYGLILILIRLNKVDY